MSKLLALSLLCLLLHSGVIYSQPSGTIVAFAGPKNKLPRGWVLCDGALYDRTNGNYTNLFNAIGTTWGGDGSNKFAVPDLRGLFLRGVSEETAVDPDKDQRTTSRDDLKSAGNRGNQVGSKQQDAFASHTHAYTDRQEGSGNHAEAGRNYGLNKVEPKVTAATGGNETRPKNAYVFWIIKL